METISAPSVAPQVGVQHGGEMRGVGPHARDYEHDSLIREGCFPVVDIHGGVYDHSIEIDRDDCVRCTARFTLCHERVVASRKQGIRNLDARVPLAGCGAG